MPNDVRRRETFFKNLVPYVETERTVILLGDFNCVSAASDSSGRNVQVDRSTNSLEEMADDHQLVDVGKLSVSQNSFKYTHFQGTSHARLDRMYVNFSIVNRISTYFVMPVPFTDHCLVALEIGKSAQRNSNFIWDLWKFNSELFTDESFNESVKNSFKELQDRPTRHFKRWEVFKENIKLIAIEISPKYVKER